MPQLSLPPLHFVMGGNSLLDVLPPTHLLPFPKGAWWGPFPSGTTCGQCLSKVRMQVGNPCATLLITNRLIQRLNRYLGGRGKTDAQPPHPRWTGKGGAYLHSQEVMPKSPVPFRLLSFQMAGPAARQGMMAVQAQRREPPSPQNRDEARQRWMRSNQPQFDSHSLSSILLKKKWPVVHRNRCMYPHPSEQWDKQNCSELRVLPVAFLFVCRTRKKSLLLPRRFLPGTNGQEAKQTLTGHLPLLSNCISTSLNMDSPA